MSFEAIDKLKENQVPSVDFDSVVIEKTRVVFNEDEFKEELKSSKEDKIEKTRKLTCYVVFGLYKNGKRISDVTRSFVRKYTRAEDELTKVEESDIIDQRDALLAQVESEYLSAANK